MSEVDDFLQGLDNQPKDDPFDPKATDPFPAEKPKEEVVVEKKEVEKPLPFHKDPKVQDFIEREIEKRISTIEKPEVPAAKPDEVNEVQDFLTQIIGNDTPEKLAAIKNGVRVFSSLEEKGAKRALAQLEEQARAEKEAEIQAQRELSDGFSNIEEQFGVDLTSSSAQAKKERSEFVDFIKRISPKDEEGNVVQFPDLEESYKLFKETKKPEPNTRAKEIAARSMDRSKDASAVQPTGDRSWRAVDKLFSKLN